MGLICRDLVARPLVTQRLSCQICMVRQELLLDGAEERQGGVEVGGYSWLETECEAVLSMKVEVGGWVLIFRTCYKQRIL